MQAQSKSGQRVERVAAAGRNGRKVAVGMLVGDPVLIYSHVVYLPQDGQLSRLSRQI